MNKQLKRFCFLESVVTSMWVLYFHHFYIFYKDALEFGAEESSEAIKLSFILIYRSQETFSFLSFAFVLLVINVFVIVVIKSIANRKIIIAVSFIQLFISLLLLNINVLYVLTIPISVISILIVYMSYIISKHRFRQRLVLKEEVVGCHGPFNSQKEVDRYEDKLVETYDISQLVKRTTIEKNKYFLEFDEKEKTGGWNEE